MALLSVRNLSVEFETRRGVVRAVDRVSFDLEPGQTLGIVGESGSGKSVSSLALMGLLAANARIAEGEILFEGRNLVGLSDRQMRQIRGRDIAMIFQDPMTSLNPSYQVGFQIQEALKLHGIGGDHYKQSIELLEQVGIPDAEERLKSYPHQLSGGMSQRVMIAIAIACSPKILVADEPTTALDVTIQAQILQLLKRLQAERKMGLILVTHDIGMVSQTADEIMVMYTGQIVEKGPAHQVIHDSRHPYTAGLLASLPAKHSLAESRTRLPTIPGMVPDLLHRPTGCQFNPRCQNVLEHCKIEIPAEAKLESRSFRCFNPVKGNVISTGEHRSQPV